MSCIFNGDWEGPFYLLGQEMGFVEGKNNVSVGFFGTSQYVRILRNSYYFPLCFVIFRGIGNNLDFGQFNFDKEAEKLTPREFPGNVELGLAQDFQGNEKFYFFTLGKPEDSCRPPRRGTDRGNEN